MNFADTLEQMNIELGDTNNVTFSVEEKTRALQKAWNDSSVVKVEWDSSLTFTTDTYQYSKPSGIDTVKDIYLSPTNSGVDFPEPISSDLWEVVEDKIQFSPLANRIIPNGNTLYIKGNNKLDYTSDTLGTTNLQEYVIALGGYNTLTLLGFKKANLFLKNDTSMSELIALRREFKQDIKEYRTRLPKEYEGA